MTRPSNHVEPAGVGATARHYLRDLVYGANDGVITTFAVVAGVEGGALSQTAVLVVGAANLAADGLSMAVGNFLAIRADESARAAENRPEEEASPVRHAGATMMAFIAAGTVPLVPYLAPEVWPGRLVCAAALALLTLFSIGTARGRVTRSRWWVTGGEMLLLGAVVAAAAYGAGAAVGALVR